MTIKIKAPKAYMSRWTVNGKLGPCEISWYAENLGSGTNARAVRIVSESDWRKMMKLVRACEAHSYDTGNTGCHWWTAVEALNALEKKK